MLNNKRMFQKILATFVIVGVLSACGGGGGGGDSEITFRPDVAPQNVQVVAGEEGLGSGVMNTISWTEVPAATQYVVYWDNVSGVTENSGVVATTDNRYIIHKGVDVVAGASYYYRVQALSGGESSILSVEVVGKPQETIVATNLNDVAWNGMDTMVAVGESGVIVHSPNGTADGWFDASVNPTTQSLAGVTWDSINVQFVVVGAGGTVLTGDGSTWNLETTPVDSDLEDVAWLGDRYIVVGRNGTILTSLDGSVWTQQSTPSNATTITLSGVASNGNRIVAVGTNGMMLASDDNGVNWVELAKLTNDELNDITWDGDRFVVVGSLTTILSSPDGITWTEHIQGLPQMTIVGVSQWDTGLPVDPVLAAVGSSGNFLLSPDFASGFMVVRTGTTEQLSAISWVDDGVNNPYFVIVGHNGTILTNQQ